MNELDIFSAALDLADPAARAHYLNDACGTNPGLRTRIEALLRNAAEASQFLESPAAAFHGATGTLVDAAASDPPTTPQPGGLDRTEMSLDGDNLNLEFLTPSDDPAVLGRIGQYTVTEVIGRGGMGIVLKANDPKLNRIVAVKVLAPELAGNATARLRFLREAQAAAAVAHQHVVTIHAVDEDRLPYLVMEYVDGVSLQEKIDRSGRLGLKETLRIGTQVASGLAAAHAHGVIHRDIKPSNILLENGVERVRITDFGLARAVDDVEITRLGEVAGTPQYMSPEQAHGETVDARSDLFNLGCVLYAMCTGRSPFRAETTAAAIRRVCDDTPRPIREINSEVPEWLVEIVDRLLLKNRDERIQTASEAADLLGRHLAHVQDPDSTPQPESLIRRPVERGRSWRRGLAAAVFLLLLGSVGLGLTESAGITQVTGTLFNFGIDRRESVEDPGLQNGRARRGNSREVRTAPDTASRRAEGIGSLEKRTELLTSGELGAFVILGRKGPGSAFDTLATAVEGAGPGDTIEVRGNGPFVTAPVLISRALTIRAADGARPVILLSPQQDESELMLLSATAPIVLEGLEFRRTVPPSIAKPRALIQSLSRLWMANCRLVTTTKHNGLWSAGSIVLRNSEFLAPDPGAATAASWGLASGQSCVIENCVMIGKVLVPYGGGELQPATSIELRRNTIVSRCCIQLGVTALPVLPGAEQSRSAVRVNVVGNVFDGHGTAVMFDQLSLPQPLDAAAAETLLRSLFDWHDERNVYASRSPVLTLSANLQLLAPGKDLAAWNRFWDFSETGTLQHAIRFEGGDVCMRAMADVQQLTAEDFRLNLDSTGLQARVDGKDLGADVDLVGPGPAYGSWKRTPAYQDWLRESGQSAGIPAAPAEARDDNAAAVRVFAGDPGCHVDCVSLSPDGRRVLSTGVVTGEAACAVWDLATGRRLHLLRGHTDVVQFVAFAPDSRTALTTSSDRTVRLWDVETGEELRRLDAPRPVPSVAWSPDGNQAVFGTYEGTVVLWDVANWTELHRFDHGTGLWSVDFCPTRRTVLTAGGKPEGADVVGVIRLWDLDTGMELHRFEGPPTGVWRAVFSPDGLRALSAEADATVRLWDVESGQEIRPFRGHVGQVFAVAFTADGRRALSGGGDRTVRLWDVDNGAELHCFRGHTNMVRSVAASVDGQYGLSGGFDGTARLWRLPPTEPIPATKEEE